MSKLYFKKYSEYMSEISNDVLYEKLLRYGMFSEKLPDIFDSDDFYKLCSTRRDDLNAEKFHDFVVYESIRNTNVPRVIGIPSPFDYEKLCFELSENWDKLVKHFEGCTNFNSYKVSRVHIRNRRLFKPLFEMNYGSGGVDDPPEIDIAMGKKFVVHADISQCFGSIYTHAISWALTTKEYAKRNQSHRLWFNKIDIYTRGTTNNETHGILIGPHTSNIISEIILTKIDSVLSKKWSYVRKIDDYTCYVVNEADAEKFVLDLNRQLRVYGLSVNQKKTRIMKLPYSEDNEWTIAIQNEILLLKKMKVVNYWHIRSIMSLVINLMNEHNQNSAIIYYAIKRIKNLKMTPSAKDYFIKKTVQLSILYPYLIPHLDGIIFNFLKRRPSDLSEYLNALYNENIRHDVFDALSHLLYYAIKFDVKIEDFNIEQIIRSNDCVLLLCAFLYCKHFKLKKNICELKKHAKKILKDKDIERYWPFVYEILDVRSLSNEWSFLKKNKISFIKKCYT